MKLFWHAKVSQHIIVYHAAKEVFHVFGVMFFLRLSLNGNSYMDPCIKTIYHNLGDVNNLNKDKISFIVREYGPKNEIPISNTV